MVEDPRDAQLEAARKKLPFSIQEYIRLQGVLNDDLLNALKKEAPYFLRWESARQEGRKRDMRRIEKGKHVDFRTYLEAGGKIPLCYSRIDFEPGRSVPTVTPGPYEYPLLADETSYDFVASGEPIAVMDEVVDETPPPNPTPVLIAPAPAREDKSLESNEPQKVDVRVEPSAPPVYQAPPVQYPPPPRGGSNWVLAVVGVVALALLVWALWPYTFGTVLGNHSPAPTMVAAAPTAQPAQSTAAPAAQTYFVGQKIQIDGIDYKVTAVGANGQPEVGPWTDSAPVSTPAPADSSAPAPVVTQAPDNGGNTSVGDPNANTFSTALAGGTTADSNSWQITYNAAIGDDPIVKAFLGALKAPDPANWKTFPNVPNKDVPGFDVANGAEYGMAESPFCENNPCDFVVPAREYRLITADYQFQDMSCNSNDGLGGCLLLLVNVGDQSYTWRDQMSDNGFTVHGRYWNGDKLDQAIWGLVSHASANMLNMPTSAHPGESLNFGSSGANGGANCGNPGGCDTVRATVVIVAADRIIAVAQTDVSR